MIRRYCDVCDREVDRNVVDERWMPTMYRKGTKWVAEVLVRKENTWNDGDLCLDCLKELLSSKEVSGMTRERLQGAARGVFE